MSCFLFHIIYVYSWSSQWLKLVLLESNKDPINNKQLKWSSETTCKSLPGSGGRTQIFTSKSPELQMLLKQKVLKGK